MLKHVWGTNSQGTHYALPPGAKRRSKRAHFPIEEKERKLEGMTKGRDERLYTILECHVNLDLEGFEDMGQDGEPTGIKLPYIVTVEEGTRKILSIRKNFEVNDPLKNCNSSIETIIGRRYIIKFTSRI